MSPCHARLMNAKEHCSSYLGHIRPWQNPDHVKVSDRARGWPHLFSHTLASTQIGTGWQNTGLQYARNPLKMFEERKLHTITSFWWRKGPKANLQYSLTSLWMIWQQESPRKQKAFQLESSFHSAQSSADLHESREKSRLEDSIGESRALFHLHSKVRVLFSLSTAPLI